jgi:hypothetical protein
VDCDFSRVANKVLVVALPRAELSTSLTIYLALGEIEYA